ncbi:MAG: hypothetical protein KUL83_12440 [Lentimicrobium sp.]|jgi:hypothetical protein|nr:hypothetical protein [Lentimicrobium sp.]MDD2528643.1 hypothetical protein [Lentimicrobiaceae bacterium]MDD4596790.1 hypothetical protein [Lentimicrobiaceae bacterium]MDY0027117.1 hypothetical protein [Lentimicrobium sp.]
MKKLWTITIFLGIVLISCGVAPDQRELSAPESTIIYTDLENTDSLLSAGPVSWVNGNTIVSDRAHSGTQSSRVDQENEFSIAFQQKLGYISQKMPKNLDITAWIYSEEKSPAGRMVVSINKVNYYESYPVGDFFAAGGEWRQFSGSFILPDSLKPSEEIKIYLWNNRKSRLWIDDISLKFTPEK